MIYEYAIDPELAATWHDPSVGRFFRAQMGLGTPRVACAFPAATWDATVLLALHTLVTDPTALQAAKTNLMSLLDHLRATRSTRDGVVTGSWFDAARREHNARRNFRGVLCSHVPYRSTTFLDAATFDPTRPMWTVDTPPVARNGLALAKAIEPLLGFAVQVRFVDRYFRADDDDFKLPMLEMLRLFQAHGSGRLTGEIHTSVDKERGSPPPKEQARAKFAAAQKHLAAAVGPKLDLTMFVWDERHGGEKFHNRYILTPHGGLAVQAGLDEPVKRDEPQKWKGHSDDVTILSPSQFRLRWSQYAPGSGAFAEVLPPTKIR